MLILAGLTAAGLVVYYAIGADGFKIMQDITVILSVSVMLATALLVFTVKKHTIMQPVS
jgi:hypothetical protein